MLTEQPLSSSSRSLALPLAPMRRERIRHIEALPRFVGGAWSPHGRYAPFTAGQHESSEDVTAIVGYRPIVPLEVSQRPGGGYSASVFCRCLFL